MKVAEKLAVRAAAMRWADILFRLYGSPRDEACARELGTWTTSADGGQTRASSLLDVEFNPKSWPVVSADLLLPEVKAKAEAEGYFHLDNGSAPAVWPISTAWVAELEDGNAQLFCTKSVDTKYARQRNAKFFGRHMARSDSIEFDCGGRVIDCGSILTYRVASGRWADVWGKGNFLARRGQSEGGMYDGPAIAIGHALRLRYEWQVVFHFPTGLRLSFSASPADIIALLNDRDKPVLGGRRASLLHWVERHWRTHKTGVSSEVMKHLRGVGKVEWRGHNIEVLPAQYEVDTAVA